MSGFTVTAAFEHIEETGEIGVEIGVWIFQRVAHAGLRGEMNDRTECTIAKNRFGEILAALAEDQRHEIHAAFGQIFERSSMGERWKLGIYHYAIFLLESPKDPPFSSPPF